MLAATNITDSLRRNASLTRDRDCTSRSSSSASSIEVSGMEEVERGGASKEIYFRTSEGITELSTAPSGAAKYAAVSCAATMCARESSVWGGTRSTFRKPIFDVF